ncbi:MAG: hypothetical protein LBD93_02950 [Treponema sp.]|jgi:hypothetical protein|nr:hypothetical protein [Treponema sp.]
MKKFIALSMVLVVLAGTGFAQLTVKGEANVALAPLVFVDNDAKDDQVGPAFGRNDGDKSEMKLDVAGAAEKVGFRVTFSAKVSKSAISTFEISDWAGVWIKPLEALKIDGGRFNIDTLRGKVGDGGLTNYTVKSGAQDDIFNRFKGENALALSLTPIQGLFIGAQLNNVADWGKETGGSPIYSLRNTVWIGGVPEAYHNVQIAAGYEIDGVGLARVQYVGGQPSAGKPDTSGPLTTAGGYQRIEAAFAYTGMSGLTLDVGGKIPLGFTEYYDAGTTKKIGNYQPAYQVSLGIQYGLDALTIPVRVDTKFGGITDNTETDDKDTVSEAFILNAHLWPSYKVLDNTSVGLDFGIEFIGETKKDGTKIEGKDGGLRIGFGAWLEQLYGPGSIKVGLAYRVAGEVDSTKEPGVFTIPVIFKAAF